MTLKNSVSSKRKPRAPKGRAGLSCVVYILECADGTFYIGSTNDIEKRLRAHNHAKSGAHYTKTRRPVILKYTEKAPSLGAARSREAQLKKLTRVQKQALIGL